MFGQISTAGQKKGAAHRAAYLFLSPLSHASSRFFLQRSARLAKIYTPRLLGIGESEYGATHRAILAQLRFFPQREANGETLLTAINFAVF